MTKCWLHLPTSTLIQLPPLTEHLRYAAANLDVFQMPTTLITSQFDKIGPGYNEKDIIALGELDWIRLTLESETKASFDCNSIYQAKETIKFLLKNFDISHIHLHCFDPDFQWDGHGNKALINWEEIALFLRT